jgi:hypothetical protein
VEGGLPAPVTQFTHSTTAFASMRRIGKPVRAAARKRKLSPVFSVQVSLSTVRYHLALEHEAGFLAVMGVEFVAGEPPGSICTRNRLSRLSLPAGLSNCFEIPVRQSFSSAR